MDLKIKDVAELLNVPEVTIRKWLVDGKIPTYKINGQYRFSRFEIEDWVVNHKIHDAEQLESSLKSCTMEEPREKIIRDGRLHFSLYRALHNGMVLQSIPGESKVEVIQETMKSVAPLLELDAEVISELLIDREQLQSTGIGNGIALPHTRDCLIEKENYDVVVLAFPESPIPYEALDGEDVFALFFLFASSDKRHLHLLSKIAHFCMDEKRRAFLRQSPDKQQLLDYVREWEKEASDH